MASGTNGRDNPDLAQKLRIPRNAVVNREELKTPKVSNAISVFLDISGYTPFTESVIKNNRDGVGQIVDELEKILRPTALSAVKNNGNIIAIEGDALLISFCDPYDVFNFCKEILPFRKTVVETQDRKYPLQMDIGISGGRLYEYVAESGGRRFYLACGSALREAHRIETFSKDGNIALNFPVFGSIVAGGIHYVDETRIPSLPERRKEPLLKRIFWKKPKNACTDLNLDQEYIDSFLPNRVRQFSESNLLSPVIAFSDFPLIRYAFSAIAPDSKKPDPKLAEAALSEFFAQVRNIVEVQYGGFIDKLGDSNSMFLFGAPYAYEDARLRAFEAISKVHDVHKTLCSEFGFRESQSLSGMHKGEALWCRILERPTVIGNSVNHAARIKQTRFSDETEEIEGDRKRIRFTRQMLDERTARLVRGYEMDRRRLKGIEDTATIFGFSTITRLPHQKEEFVLRKNELARLLELGRISVGNPGSGIALNVIGDSGSGKDRLLSLVASKLQNEGISSYELRCSPSFHKDPYRSLFELMKKVGGHYSDQELFEKTIGKKPECGKDFSQLLDNFKTKLLSMNAAYFINNGDNIDRESADFFARLAPLCPGSGCFIALSVAAPLFQSENDIILHNLSEEESAEFAKEVAKRNFPSAVFGKKAIQGIFGKSGGNPMFISELVKSMDIRSGKLVLRKKLPDGLKELMLRNLQENLSPESRDILEKYSLMHSVALMAPLTDRDFEINSLSLQTKGLLREDLEFASDMLQKALAESIDPRKRQEICQELAIIAEKEGLNDYFVIFEYYRNAKPDPLIRQKALEYAEKHVQDTGYLYLIRDEFYNNVLDLAHDLSEVQGKVIGMMLYRLAYSVSHADLTIENMNKAYMIAKRSHSFLAGDEMEFRALSQMANALTSIGHLESTNPELAIQSKKHLGEGKILYADAIKKAHEAGKIPYYLLTSIQFANALSIWCNEPRAAMGILKGIEKELPELIGKMEPNAGNRAVVALFYKSVAEALQRMGTENLPQALKYTETGLEKSEEIGYAEGILMCRATKAEILFKMGDYEMAMELAQMALRYIEEKDLKAAEVEVDMENIISKIKDIRSSQGQHRRRLL